LLANNTNFFRELSARERRLEDDKDKEAFIGSARLLTCQSNRAAASLFVKDKIL
jgi:hypothetical protein